MYHTCLSCSGDLGTNRSFEPFSVGRELAFDPHTGRLWVVCPHCSRWNLAAIEERWEIVETAEYQFSRTPQREQMGAIGLAELPDGTRLVRIGTATRGELAVWRYGQRLIRRRFGYAIDAIIERNLRFTIPIVFSGVLAPVAVAGLPLVAAIPIAAVAGFAVSLPSRLAWRKQALRPLLVLGRPASKGGEVMPTALRVIDAVGTHLDVDANGDLSVRLDTGPIDDIRHKVWRNMGVKMLGEPVTLVGDDARTLLRRLMVAVNRAGATKAQVHAALAELTLAGGATEFVNGLAKARVGIGVFRRDRPRNAPGRLPPVESLALEIALHEELESSVLLGELRGLRAAWEEADHIASIADSL